MCGIAGILARTAAAAPDRDELVRMAAVLRHRGPDGHGFLLDRELGFAHTRLSLVDLAGGAQPIRNEDGTVWMVANGEVFDHRSHRVELERRGHRFRTDTDVEVLLHAFEEWGHEAWRRFDGQFAVALWEPPARRLHLVRDRFGVLPLYYAFGRDALVFGSECKALFASGRVSARLHAGAVQQAFTAWSALPPRSVFAGVAAVAPGTAVRIDANLELTSETWWRYSPAVAPNGGRSLDESAEALEAHLNTAVRRRLAADVTVGSYLSGGLDSSLLTALAAEQNADLTTFGIRFEDSRYDESSEQQAACAALGTEHHEVLCRSGDVRRLLPEVVWHCETPLLRTAPVPLFMLSRLVQQCGIKAVLSGEGADELLGGYSIFLEDRVRRFWARQPASTTRPALLGRVHDFVATSEQRAGAMWRAFYGTGLTDVHDPFYAHAVRWRNSTWTTRVLRGAAKAPGALAEVAADVRGLLPDGFEDWPPLARAQAVETVSFLGPYLLACQGDRVALGHGVEARYPYLGRDVVDCCARLPDRHKVVGLTTKVVLRRVAGRHLPESLARRPKQPYRAPIDASLFVPAGGDYADELLAPQRLAANESVAAPAAERLIAKVRRGTPSEREAMAACGLLTLQLVQDQFTNQFPGRVRDAVAQLPARADVDLRTVDGAPL